MLLIAMALTLLFPLVISQYAQVSVRQVLTTCLGYYLLDAAMLCVGVLVSVIQAATQIQEMTLTFIPKIVCMFIALLLALPWLMERMISYTREIFINIPNYIRG